MNCSPLRYFVINIIAVTLQLFMSLLFPVIVLV